MKIKIWGARGSIPAPLGPAAVREKIISAFLEVARIEDEELREAFISAILADPQPGGAVELDAAKASQARRRQIVEKYLDSLSPLAGTTASGNTPCIEIQSGDDFFIIDAGSGIRQLGLELMNGPCGRGEGVIHLFFSHPHWDHLQGFPFFRPAFIPGNQIFIYSIHDIETALERQQETLNFPIPLNYMQATRTFIRLQEGEMREFGDLRVRNIRNQHPGDAYGFRFEKGDKVFVYASDASYPDGVDMRPYLNFFADADVVIFDAQFTQRESDEKEDWGHSSSFVGVEMAQQANVKNLVLFHYDPTYSDAELEKILEDAKKFQQNQYPDDVAPVNILIAQEGQTFNLVPAQKTQIQQLPGSQTAILKPVGIFDEHVAAQLREQFSELLRADQPAQVIVDMTGVEMLQVAGLRTLVKLRNEQQGIPLVLAGLSNNVQQLIDLAGYIDFFAIYPSVPTALKALRAHETLHLPGQTLKGRYKIESKIGEGHLGTVFKAIDTRENLPVAIKILSPSFSEGAIERFSRQARQIINLVHPNIANIYNCDEDRGLSFMATELISGKTLRDILDEYAGQPLPFYAALGIGEKITQALEYAHAHGVVHGDLKPKNVLLSGEEVKITDFGLGRLESGRSLININVPLALVTANYLAPEQVLGHPIDSRTDLYALGVILYEMFTGQPPFSGSDQEVLDYHLNKVPVPPRSLNPRISRSLEHLILKLLDKDPNKRFAKARKVRQILSSMFLPMSGNVKGHAFAGKRWPAFVGREAALNRLVELWHESRQGQGQVVLVSGKSGTGKTRLVQELIDRLDEATLLIGYCRKIEGGLAYQPFISALEDYFENISIKAEDKSVAYIWQQAVQLLPEIGRVIQGPALPPAVDGQPARQAAPTGLFESIAGAMRKRPWLLILDDIQWADPSSLIFLSHLAAYCTTAPLMIIGIYEENGSEPKEYLDSFLSGLEHQENYTAISLDPLTQAETKQVLESIWSSAVPQDLTTAIHNRAQGNPLFIEEIAKGLADEGVVTWQDDKWYFGSVAEAGLPQRIDEAILRRASYLSRETQTLLNQAAILGPLFRFEDLQQMSDLSVWDTLENLNILLELQLLKEAPAGTLLQFGHIKIQQVLYQGLSSLKRRFLHREAGEALERQHAFKTREIAPVLAHHFFEADELEKGLAYTIQAANQANGIYANQNALYWYTRALDVIEQLGSDYVGQYQQFELLLARERIYHDLGLRQAQQADLDLLRQLAQELNEPAKQANIHIRQSAYEYVMSYVPEANTEAQAALIAARQAGNVILESKSLIQLANIALHHGLFDQAHEHLHEARSVLKKANNQQVEARILNGFGDYHRLLNTYTESETYYQHALVISQLVGDRPGQAVYLSNLADLLLRKGQYADTISYQQEALLINRTIGKRQGEALCLNRVAMIYKELGQYKLALQYGEQAKSVHQQIQDEQGLAEDLQLVGATLAAANGDYKTAQDYIGQALEIFQRLKNKVQQMNAWLELGLCLEGLADFTKACYAYEQVCELNKDQLAPDARAGIARSLLENGKVDQARQEVETYLAALNTNGIFGVRYPIRLYLIAYRVLKADGRAPEAAAVLEQGRMLLESRAQNIADSDLQASFRGNVAENREILSLSE